MTCNGIKIIKGNGGHGRPLVITSTEEKRKSIYVIDGGEKSAIVDKITELTGMETVSGFRALIPDDEIALTIIDYGDTLCCGIYPKEGAPTINVVPTGEGGPLAQYINETTYVSAVGLKQITLTLEEAAADTEKPISKKTGLKYDISKKITEQKAEQRSFVTKIDMGAGKVVATFNQSAREDVQMMINTVAPFMVSISLLIGVVQDSGIDEFFASIMAPLAGNVVGLTITDFICFPSFLFPLLGPGAIISQVIDTLIDVEIGRGNIPPQLVLPVLFATNTQDACDFTPVGSGLEEAEVETAEVGAPSVLYSCFLNGTSRIPVTWLASFGPYS